MCKTVVRSALPFFFFFFFFWHGIPAIVIEHGPLKIFNVCYCQKIPFHTIIITSQEALHENTQCPFFTPLLIVFFKSLLKKQKHLSIARLNPPTTVYPPIKSCISFKSLHIPCYILQFRIQNYNIPSTFHCSSQSQTGNAPDT